MTDSKPQDVDAYIAAADEAAQPTLRRLREIIRSAVPDAVEKISYGMPYYAYHGRLAYFAAHKHHVGLYALGPASRYSAELQRYAAARSTLQFPFGAELPADALRRLVEQQAVDNATPG
jgi:uncharacterized protein YdhG (YjbR/CyaY superfamily)